MEDLEQQLSKLPKARLSKRADFKIKFKIRGLVLLKNLQKFVKIFFHPHSLVAKVSLTALAIFVVLGGTAVYAVNNDQVTPGSVLYPLKKTIENVEQQLSLTKNAKVDTLNKLSERRLKEALNLAGQDDAKKDSDQVEEVNNNIEQSIDEAVNNFDSAIETSQKIEDAEDSQKAREVLKKKQESMVKYLDNISDIAKNKKDEKMVKKINEAKEAISKYDQMLERDDSDVYIEPAPNSGNGGVMKNSRDNDSSRSNNGESKDEGNVDSANSPESNRDSGQGRGRRD